MPAPCTILLTCTIDSNTEDGNFLLTRCTGRLRYSEVDTEKTVTSFRFFPQSILAFLQMIGKAIKGSRNLRRLGSAKRSAHLLSGYWQTKSPAMNHELMSSGSRHIAELGL